MVGLLWLACAEAPLGVSTPLPSIPSEPPRIEVLASRLAMAQVEAHLVGVVELTADRPVTLTLEVDDPCGTRRIAFPDLAADFRVPLLGLHLGADHTVRAELDDGELLQVVEIGTLTADAPPIPPVAVHAFDPDRMEPGLIVLPVVGPDSWLVVIDAALHPVYALRWGVDDVELDAEGNWVGLRIGAMSRRAITGEVLETWPTDRRYSHEVHLPGDGSVVTLQNHPVLEEDYPAGPDLRFTSPQQIIAQGVVRVVDQVDEPLFSLADLLDTTHVGWSSLTPLADWSHANSVSRWGDDAWIVSVRHLDLVVCVGDDGALRWLLGDPAGWTSPWIEHFLTPVGELVWPRMQHDAQQASGNVLTVFDNGNHDDSPYTEGDPDYVPTSRAVAFRVDEEAMTVEQLWSVGHEGLFSYAMGSARLRPQTGNVLMDFARVGGPEGTARIVEIHPERPQEPVLDLEIGVDVSRFVYRALPLQQLYPPEVIETRSNSVGK